MRKRTIVGAGAAAIVTAGAVVIPLTATAQATPSSSTEHVLKFKSVLVPGGEIDFSTTDLITQRDLNAKGNAIGIDTLYITFNPKTKALAGIYVLDLEHGVIYAQGGTPSGSSTFSGVITGGRGDYKGITGTVTAQLPDKASLQASMIIKYRL
jgi:hypothetical protein